MKFLIITWVEPHLLDTITAHGDEYFHCKSSELLTVPYPYEGYLLYGGQKIFIDDYDAVVVLGINNLSRYCAHILRPHCCLIGEPTTRAIMSDKVETGIVLSNAGINVIKSVWSLGDADITYLNGADGYIVEKPKNRSLGIGVVRHKKEEFKPTVDNLIYQEYIKCGHADERWLIVNGKIVCGEKRRSADNEEFRANLSLGGIGEPLEITEEMQEMAKKIYEPFKNGGVYTGADIMHSVDGKMYVCEVNAAPGQIIIDITGHDFFEDIYDYMVEEAKKWKENKKNERN